MRTRFSSHPSVRALRPVSAFAVSDFALNARRLTLALAASAPLCAGALLAGPAQAAPTVESDENGPLVQIVKPGYNDVLKGKYRILIQVTARKYNPQSVEMFIDDKSATKGPMEISSFASSSYDFDTRLLSEGRHKLTVRVTDSQGFRGWSEVTVFVNNKGVVDTQVPDLRWVGIEPFQEISGSMKLEVNAADNFGVKMLQISINPADTPNKPAYSWFMNQPPYKVNLDTIGKNIPDGLYVLKALAFDSLDQQGDAPPLTFGIVNNQINATRVQDMLDGQRQMQKVLASEKLSESAAPKVDAKAVPAPEKPARVLAVPTPAAPTVAQKAAPTITDAAPARSSAPATQTRPVPQSESPEMGAPSTYGQNAPALSSPSFAQPSFDNPGIQLPRVNAPGASVPAAPRTVPQIASPEVATAPTVAAPVADETRIAQVTPDEIAPTEVAPTVEVTPTVEAAPTDAAPIVEAAPTRTEPTRIARAFSLPIGQRNAGEASLSRAAAVELALTPTTGATIESARGSQPIAVARFSQPGLSGRMVTDVAVLSQSASVDESRLSNAELSRARAGKTRILNAARPIAANATEPTLARALQTSAPAVTERPILGRAVTADSVSTPASKLTREAQTTPLAPPKTAQAALAGTLSKAVANNQRLAPLAPEVGTNSALPAQTRGALSKAVASQQRAKPIEVAPTRVARNSASAPQLSALSAPRMNESASGLGVPSLIPQTVANPTTAAASMNGERVAALPRPDAARRNRSGASIVAVPLNAPLEISTATALPVPTSYRAERNTTLRAIAARYGLPVDLVALSNGLPTDAKVAIGTDVKLPRPLQVSYNGAPVTGDAPSMLMGDTAVTAFRFMFEKTGGKMEWDAANQRVIAKKDGREITLTIGSNVAKIGEREVMMELAAFLFQGRTMVPLRFFEEGLNAQVEWNPQTGRLVVAMAG